MTTLKQLRKQREEKKELKKETKEETDEKKLENFLEGLKGNLEFERYFVQPAKLRITDAQNMRIEDIHAVNDDSMKEISDKVARQIVYNQGYIDGIMSVLGDYI